MPTYRIKLELEEASNGEQEPLPERFDVDADNYDEAKWKLGQELARLKPVDDVRKVYR